MPRTRPRSRAAKACGSARARPTSSAPTGGNLGIGQVWADDLLANTVTLVVESTDAGLLEAPDNITVGPDGRLYLFEDGSGGDNIVGVNARGELFKVAENVIGNGSGFCGGCFSHDGRFMFANMRSPGLTLVIEGPWRGLPHATAQRHGCRGSGSTALPSAS